MDVSTQLEQVERRFLQEKLFAQAYTLFGGLALLLASIGLFGLMSYSVVAPHQRDRHPHGARRAARTTCCGLVMRESMVLVAVGVVIGLAVAFGAEPARRRRCSSAWRRPIR